MITSYLLKITAFLLDVNLNLKRGFLVRNCQIDSKYAAYRTQRI